MAKEKVVLAYSGGLDTSIAIRWLQEKYDLEVIALAVDVGQGKDLEKVRQKGLEIGAKESLVVDAREEFAQEFILPALKANALYEGKYPLISALSRPLIARHLAEVARTVGADFVAHGCTGKGNDQVRFEVSLSALAPELKVIAPVRESAMSRERALEYARENKIPVEATKESPYSVDENLWGRTIECGILEDPWAEPPADVFEKTVEPSKAPDEPAYLEVEFVKGKPVKLDGQALSLKELIEKADQIAGRYGYGRVDMIENRLIGIKSREIYEAPGALALITCHQALEDLTLERELLHYKAMVEQKYGELVYYGLWYSHLKKALDAFIEESQQDVNGSVRLKLYKEAGIVTGRKSEQSLYDYSLATYDQADQFSHQSAKGFIELFGLPLKIWARRQKTEH